jgi:hypothetical protein
MIKNNNVNYNNNIISRPFRPPDMYGGMAPTAAPSLPQYLIFGEDGAVSKTAVGIQGAPAVFTRNEHINKYCREIILLLSNIQFKGGIFNIFKYVSHAKIEGSPQKLVITTEDDPVILFQISNLAGLLVSIFISFKLVSDAQMAPLTAEGVATEIDRMNNFIDLIFPDNTQPPTDEKLLLIIKIFQTFGKFPSNSDYYETLTYGDADKLASTLNDLLQSDSKLDAWSTYILKVPQYNNNEFKKSWGELSEQLIKLQILIFIKKISRPDKDIITPFIDALNGKMKIVNSVLADNVSGEELDIGAGMGRKYLKYYNPSLENQNGGYDNNNFLEKYLKYKTKYLLLT